MIKPRLVDKPLVIYGKGKLGALAKEIFYELKIRPHYVFDDKCSFKALRKDVLVALCVATEPYCVVTAPLSKAGWKDIVPVWEIIEAYPRIGLHNGWTIPWKEMSIKEEAQCDTVFSRLDRKSQVHYRSFMGWRTTHFEQVDMKLLKKRCLPSSLLDIRQRQRVVYLDDAPMKRVSIHNEGHELNMLIANLYLFRRYRPTIEVACYHSPDGLWKIPLFLMKNLPDYKFTFRMTAWMGQGAYLFCTPKEKK